jgi:hypothetical protein
MPLPLDSFVRNAGEEINTPHQSNPQRTLARDLVNAIGMIAALNFARERQWFGVIDQINSIWPADPAA